MGKTIKSWTRPDGSEITELKVPSNIAGIRVNKILGNAFANVTGIDKITVAASNAEELPGAPWGATGVEVEYRMAPIGPGPGPTPGSKLPLGGRIFYDDGDNGATYKFYDASGNEIAYSGSNPETALANAVSYEVSGTPTKDRFYVFNELVNNKWWGKYSKLLGIKTDGIGLGKPNTQIALTKDTGSTIWENGTIFKYIMDCNTNGLNGCSDWYIGSKAEIEKLFAVESDLDIDLEDKNIWSSVEYDDTEAWVYHHGTKSYSYSYWYDYMKNYSDDQYCCFAMRSF